MSTLIFDIETVGEAWETLDETTKQSLTRWVDRASRDEEEKEVKRRDLREGLGFSPLTGLVVAIGAYDLERERGAVYYTGRGDEADEEIDGFKLKQRSEPEMLEDFWAGAKGYDIFVTFNGRRFDLPFLLHRAAIHGVKGRPAIMDKRYLSQQGKVRHIDLQDQLTFYGAMHRMPSLHMFCRAYGIESPKAGGVVGDDVAALFAAGRFRDIAVYNAADVRATVALYRRWLEYFAPKGDLEHN